MPKKLKKIKIFLKKLLPTTVYVFNRTANQIIKVQTRQAERLKALDVNQKELLNSIYAIRNALGDIIESQQTSSNKSFEYKQELSQGIMKNREATSTQQQLLLQGIMKNREATSTQQQLLSQEIMKNREATSTHQQLLSQEIMKNREVSSKEFRKITSIIRSEISAKTIFYNASGERERYKDSFAMLLGDKVDIEEEFLRLVKGMDSDSIAVVTNILKRMQTVLNSDKDRMNILTKEEQEEIRYISQHIRSCVMELSDTLFTYKGYLLPYNYFDLSAFYYKHGLDTIENISRIRGKDIIDAGAFIGDSALILSSYTDRKVYSFEAVYENYLNLVKTVELNSLENVVTINKAVGAETKTIKLNIGEKVWCSAIKPNHSDDYVNLVDVEATTLDDFVAENNLDVGLIKVDIEGAEQDFIKGAEKTIVEQKPIILISIYHNAGDFFNVKPMLEALVPEYKFIVHKPMPNVILLETSLIALPPQLW